MPQQKKEKIHRIYGIVLTIALITASLCLMAACLYLYCNGVAQKMQPFTPERVSAAFRAVSLPVCLAVMLLLGSFVLHVALPTPQDNRSSGRASRIPRWETASKAPRIARWSLLCTAIIAIIAGLAWGGAEAIIANAIAICTGCIGLG